MTLTEFREAISRGVEPDGLSTPLRSLWYDALGDWPEAHNVAQSDSGGDSARVHAYLHRKEGDTSNAQYWYTRAQCPPADSPLGKEWESLVIEFLNKVNKQTTLPELP